MKNLYEALAAFQKEMPAVLKEGKNPFFKSKYATLTDVQQTIQPTLSKCGLVVLQPVGADERGHTVTTRIVHSASGEMIESTMVLMFPRDTGITMQDLGSAITYARRYGLSAMLNIVIDDDDDGNAASAKTIVATPKIEQKDDFVNVNNKTHGELIYNVLVEAKHPEAPIIARTLHAKMHGKILVKDIKAKALELITKKG